MCETPENVDIGESEPETAQETDQGEANTQEAEPVEGEFQCGKCKDVSTLTLDGLQDCQICGSRDWKVIGEAGKRMAAAIKKGKGKV